MSFLGKYFAAASAGITDPVVGVSLTRAEVIEICNRVWQSFHRQPYPELLSCFDQGQLWTLLGLQINEDELDNGVEALSAAIWCGDRNELVRIANDKIEYALYSLLQNPRSAIHEIKVVDDFTPEAAQEYVALARKFQHRAPRKKTTIQELTQKLQEQVQDESAVPAAPVLRPTEQCAADYAGPNAIGAQAFKNKWVDNTNNRRIYEQACAEGRL